MIKAIVTDIEGTTSSLSFVKDTLFPYARARICQYIKDHEHNPEIAAILRSIAQRLTPPAGIEEICRQLIEWIDADKKDTDLKALQGRIWEAGYNNGDFYGHVYSDAVECLKKWRQQGLRLYVYSSGSVLAQKLLFAHTEFGDITELFDDYFDTRIGAKVDAAAYRAIVKQLALSPQEILFLSDVEAELNAAAESGLRTTLLVRGQTNGTSSRHTQVQSFYQILV